MGAVVLGHVPLGIWYIVTVYQQNLIQWWDWLFAILYMAFFAGVIMIRLGYGLLGSKESQHPFDHSELTRFNRARRLEYAGITAGQLPTQPTE